jgi:hypothetical protein
VPLTSSVLPEPPARRLDNAALSRATILDGVV